MRYSELIFALVFQTVVQRVPVGGLGALGAVLVLSGVGAVAWKAYRKARSEGSTLVSVPLTIVATPESAVMDIDASSVETRSPPDPTHHHESPLKVPAPLSNRQSAIQPEHVSADSAASSLASEDVPKRIAAVVLQASASVQ